jgi:ribonuclease HI
VTTAGGEELTSRGEAIGPATNNVAEYRAMLLGIELARELGATEVELVGDSELVVRQIKGEYKVKKAELKPLFLEVLRGLRQFDEWAVRHVPREENEAADVLVNETLDRRSKEGRS